jgi:hypothetical protein
MYDNKELKLVKDSGLFDDKWYTATYKDVKNISLTPLEHFLTYGWIMRRDPSKMFSTSKYLDKYPDIEKTKTNPLIHYLSCGKNEGRKKFESDLSKVRVSDTMSNLKNMEMEQANINKYKILQKENKNLQQENELLIVQLHQVQEEFEKLYLEKKIE